MERRDVEWLVVYKDNTPLSQFNGKEERKFSDIDFDNVKEFSLVTPGLMIIVKPDNGRFILASLINNSFIESRAAVGYSFECLKDKELDIVYFKRTTKELSQDNLKVLKEKAQYFVGLKTKDDEFVRLIRYDNGDISIVEHK